MAASASNVVATELVSGLRLIAGNVTMDSSYASGGETFDLSTYFTSTSTPIIILSGDDGYELQSDRGTAAANKVLAFEAGADTGSLDEVTATTDLSAVIGTFVAIGEAAQS